MPALSDKALAVIDFDSVGQLARLGNCVKGH
jgi:hypothetical protein